MTSVERFIIVSRIYRPEPAAASLFLGSVSDALAEAGHEVEVLTVTPPRALRKAQGQGSRRAKPGTERVRMFPVLRDAQGYVRGYVQYMSFDIPLAFRLLFARRPAAVFVEPPPTTGAVVRVVCGLRRIPYVYDAADIWSDAAGHATSSTLVVRVLRWIERFAMRGARAMTTISEGVVGRVRELGVRTPMTVTGFGADTSVFAYSPEPLEKVFLYAGTFTELHGADILIDAFARFSETHPGYRLKFMGNGTGQDRMRETAQRLGVGESVEFADPVAVEELRPQLCAAVASLATLDPDGGYAYAFTSKAYSSLASGCPVIFAGPGPTVDFLREASRSVPAGAAVAYDAEAIATAMREAADNPLPPDERQRLADWARAEHSMLATGRKVREVIVQAAVAAQAPKRPNTPQAAETVETSEATRPNAPAQGSRASVVKRFFASAADWAVKNRSRMPRWAGRLMESAARNPDGFIGRVSGKLLGGGASANTEVPEGDLRVYIAPTNYSGQGYLWARSLEKNSTSIGARNCAIQLPGGYAFPADALVSIATVNTSAEWAEAEWQAVKHFTHVLVEAERPMFGKRFGRDPEAEVRALEAAGVSVAFICHGTDIRDPERHAALTPWSPYPEDPRTADLQGDARENAALLERLDRPVFVSTPDLLLDVPRAVWCPVVVDAERFATDAPLFAGEHPRVIHASSNPLQKGSDRIEPALAPLIDAGAIEYELIGSTPSAEMPGVFAGADIVLDQFRLGSYGVAACEAMAAGRVVVGHVLPQVRETVERDAGVPLPIVEATPDTLHEVVAGLITDPERMRELASAGPAFVARMHTGAASARALTEHWISAG